MYYPTVYLLLVVLLHLPNVASAADVNAKVGERILIPCKITGTYVLPDWTKDEKVSIAIQADPTINPDYSARISYHTDQRTLIVDPVQLSDTGNYVCTHNGGLGSPQNTTVEITATTTTTTTTTTPAPPSPGFSKTTMIIIITCSCSAAVIVVIIVLVLIRRKKKQIEKKFPNKNETFRNKTVMSQNENVMFSNETLNDA